MIYAQNGYFALSSARFNNIHEKDENFELSQTLNRLKNGSQKYIEHFFWVALNFILNILNCEITFEGFIKY